MRRILRVCLHIFLGLALGTVVGASVGTPRKYSELKAACATAYLSFYGDYAYLQYKHANTESARQALHGYLDSVSGFESEKLPQMNRELAFDSGLTYLRLYRLETAANDTAEADRYMKLSEPEFASLGWKDTSKSGLQKFIETREKNELPLDGHGPGPGMVPTAATLPPSQGKDQSP